MKKLLPTLLALLLLLAGCAPEEAVNEPTPTAEPSATATPTPTSIPLPTTRVPLVRNSEQTFSAVFGIEDAAGVYDATCYDALCYYFKGYGSKDELVLYSLAMLDDLAYTDEDGYLNLIGWMGQYPYHDLAWRWSQGIEPLYSNSPMGYGGALVRFVIRNKGVDEPWCVEVLHTWAVGGHERDVLGKPNEAIYERHLKGEYDFRASARPLTPTDPDELLELYLEHWM